MDNNVINANQIIEQQILKANTACQKMRKSAEIMLKSYKATLENKQRMNEEIGSMFKTALANRRNYESIVHSISQSLAQINSQALERLKTAIKENAKINVPVVSEHVRNRMQFIKIASQLEIPIYFEIDTELQDKILEMCKGDTEEEEYSEDQIRQIIFQYFDKSRLDEMLDYWLREMWIDERRKRHLLQAIELHNKGYYSGSTSILMCQIGGLIDDLYTKMEPETCFPVANCSRLLEKYKITKPNSDKAKILRMMAAQTRKVVLWYYSVNYLMNYTYSSNKDIEHFISQPGRNKICHGEQLDFDTEEHSLKAILVTDIIILLGMDMMSGEEYAVR